MRDELLDAYGGPYQALRNERYRSRRLRAQKAFHRSLLISERMARDEETTRADLTNDGAPRRAIARRADVISEMGYQSQVA